MLKIQKLKDWNPEPASDSKVFPDSSFFFIQLDLDMVLS